MKRWKQILFRAFIFACLAVLFGPFLVPVPELGDLVTEKEFADPDSKFIEVNDVTVHYKEMGEGETTFILLHGFGSSVFSWREVMDDFSKHGRVIAYDRPAFGLTERPMPETWKENPYGMGANVELLRGLMDALKIEKAVLVGNSAGGGVSVAFALTYPERVEKLILVDPGVGGGYGPQFPAWALPIMWTPQMRHLGPLMMRDYQETLPNTIAREWANEANLSAEVKQEYLSALQIKNWDRAFYELTFAPAYPELRPLLPNLTVDTFIIAGADDRLIRSWYFEAISLETPAPLVLLSQCGHVPHEECPERFMQEVINFLEL
ncbi:alpha/beta hydrolase [Candidatus Villigracilis affinis]|uniref:alpha/beta fold hydrolase n=1 Tax=Candidatus Villigracilis affinis TaxID=3140682 RepID=UPI002A20BEAC|nr:alpha/beta hydrolase [Anaerolineales bacterium]